MIAAVMWGKKIKCNKFRSVLERLQCGCVHVVKTTHDLIPSQTHSRKQRSPVGCVFNTPINSYLELYAKQKKIKMRTIVRYEQSAKYSVVRPLREYPELKKNGILIYSLFKRYASRRLALLLNVETAALFPASTPATRSLYISKRQPYTRNGYSVS